MPLAGQEFEMFVTTVTSAPSAVTALSAVTAGLAMAAILRVAKIANVAPTVVSVPIANGAAALVRLLSTTTHISAPTAITASAAIVSAQHANDAVIGTRMCAHVVSAATDAAHVRTANTAKNPAIIRAATATAAKAAASA